jgi:Ca-activated chloride channel family protein
MFRFADPLYFLLLLPLIAAAWSVYRRRIRSGLLFAPTARLAGDIGTWRRHAAEVLPAVFVLGLALIVISLARPQTMLSQVRRSANAIAIEMVVDVSGSMEALDLSIKTASGTKWRTRLDAVKEAFTHFVNQRPDDLIGIVTFGGYASTRAPLTFDHEALLHVLKGVDVPRQVQDGGTDMPGSEEFLTAIGDGLATAAARITTAPAKSRIIVLLSDGESNTGIIQPGNAADAAKKLGIKVYTIGLGSNGPAPFRTRDVFGRQVIAQAVVSMDEDLLKKIANTTGGRYFNVKDPQGLDSTMEEIDKLEKTRIEREEYTQYRELYPPMLSLAFLLMLAGTGANMLITRRIV